MSFVAVRLSTFPALSVAFERNWYTPFTVAVNVPEVWVVPASQVTQPEPRLYWTSYFAMSVTPPSGPQLTGNDKVLSYLGRGFTWDPGRTVSTIVHVSFAFDGPASRFPARSSATVANSYTPSALAVKEKKPNGCAVCVANGVHPPPLRL